jgi:hypothetical protein
MNGNALHCGAFRFAAEIAVADFGIRTRIFLNTHVQPLETANAGL